MAIKLPDFAAGPRARKILRYVGLTLFALITFVFALQMTFPYDRVKDKIIEALAEKYDVTIGGVERSIVPGRVYFTAVTLRTRQTKPDETITTFFIKKLELDAGLLSVLGGTLSMDMNAEIGAGTLEGSVAVGSFGRGDIDAHFVGSHLPGDALPMRAVLGLPMTGKIDFDVSLALPMEKSKSGKSSINWQKAVGAFSLGCPTGCTFGDGVTKLKPLLKNTRNQVMVGEGIDFGKVTMTSLIAKASIKSGKMTVDKFETVSKDGELHVDYAMTLEKQFGDSQVTGCLRFKGTEDLLKREPKTYAAITTTGAELRGDGLFHILLTGRFDEMKRLNQECGPNGKVGGGDTKNDRVDRSERPNLSIQPVDHSGSGSGSATGSGSAMAGPPTPPIEPPPAAAAHDAGMPPPPTPPGVNPATGGPMPTAPNGAVNGAAPAGSGAPATDGVAPAITNEAPGSAAPATPPPE